MYPILGFSLACSFALYLFVMCHLSYLYSIGAAFLMILYLSIVCVHSACTKGLASLVVSRYVLSSVCLGGGVFICCLFCPR